MRVTVDRDACEANGVCVGLVPEIFELGEDDTLHIREADVPEDLAKSVLTAVRACPKAALTADE
jgi:ferredoxin